MEPLVELAVIGQIMAEAIPFNKLLGMRCESLERGLVRSLVPFRPELIGDATRPALHGGVLSALADATCGAAVFTLLRPGDSCSTIDLRLDYLRPGREQDIRCEARVLRLGGQVAVTEARLYQDSGADIAVAKGVFMVRRGKKRGEEAEE